MKNFISVGKKNIINIFDLMSVSLDADVNGKSFLTWRLTNYSGSEVFETVEEAQEAFELIKKQLQEFKPERFENEKTDAL